jgi:hypothetical protein
LSSSCGMETLVEIIVHVFLSGGLVQKSCQIYRVRGPTLFYRFFELCISFFFIFLDRKKEKKKETAKIHQSLQSLGSSRVIQLSPLNLA